MRGLTATRRWGLVIVLLFMLLRSVVQTRAELPNPLRKSGWLQDLLGTALTSLNETSAVEKLTKNYTSSPVVSQSTKSNVLLLLGSTSSNNASASPSNLSPRSIFEPTTGPGPGIDVSFILGNLLQGFKKNDSHLLNERRNATTNSGRLSSSTLKPAPRASALPSLNISAILGNIFVGIQNKNNITTTKESYESTSTVATTTDVATKSGNGSLNINISSILGDLVKEFQNKNNANFTTQTDRLSSNQTLTVTEGIPTLNLNLSLEALFGGLADKLTTKPPNTVSTNTSVSVSNRLLTSSPPMPGSSPVAEGSSIRGETRFGGTTTPVIMTTTKSSNALENSDIYNILGKILNSKNNSSSSSNNTAAATPNEFGTTAQFTAVVKNATGGNPEQISPRNNFTTADNDVVTGDSFTTPRNIPTDVATKPTNASLDGNSINGILDKLFKLPFGASQKSDTTGVPGTSPAPFVLTTKSILDGFDFSGIIGHILSDSTTGQTTESTKRGISSHRTTTNTYASTSSPSKSTKTILKENDVNDILKNLFKKNVSSSTVLPSVTKATTHSTMAVTTNTRWSSNSTSNLATPQMSTTIDQTNITTTEKTTNLPPLSTSRRSKLMTPLMNSSPGIEPITQPTTLSLTISTSTLSSRVPPTKVSMESSSPEMLTSTPNPTTVKTAEAQSDSLPRKAIFTTVTTTPTTTKATPSLTQFRPTSTKASAPLSSKQPASHKPTSLSSLTTPPTAKTSESSTILSQTMTPASKTDNSREPMSAAEQANSNTQKSTSGATTVVKNTSVLFVVAYITLLQSYAELPPF